MSIRNRLKLRRGVAVWVASAMSIVFLQVSACSVPTTTAPEPEPTAAPSGTAAEHINRGISLQQSKDLPGAIAAYRQALAIEPDNGLAHYNLASALSERQDYDEAIAEYREALRLQPDLVLAHFGLGYALAGKGDKIEAVEEFQIYLREAPLLGHEEAKRKVEEDIKTLEAGMVGDRVNRGIELEKKGDFDAAIAEYRTALAAEPNHAVAHYNLGSALSGKKEYKAAIAEYRKALALQPDLNVAHMRLGYALAFTGNKRAAIAEFETYLSNAPEQEAELKQKVREDIRKLRQR